MSRCVETLQDDAAAEPLPRPSRLKSLCNAQATEKKGRPTGLLASPCVEGAIQLLEDNHRRRRNGIVDEDFLGKNDHRATEAICATSNQEDSRPSAVESKV